MISKAFQRELETEKCQVGRLRQTVYQVQYKREPVSVVDTRFLSDYIINVTLYANGGLWCINIVSPQKKTPFLVTILRWTNVNLLTDQCWASSEIITQESVKHINPSDTVIKMPWWDYPEGPEWRLTGESWIASIAYCLIWGMFPLIKGC